MFQAAVYVVPWEWQCSKNCLSGYSKFRPKNVTVLWDLRMQAPLASEPGDQGVSPEGLPQKLGHQTKKNRAPDARRSSPPEDSGAREHKRGKVQRRHPLRRGARKGKGKRKGKGRGERKGKEKEKRTDDAGKAAGEQGDGDPQPRSLEGTPAGLHPSYPCCKICKCIYFT